MVPTFPATLRRKSLALVVGAALAGAVAPAQARDVTMADLMQELKRLSARVEKLERRNTELETELEKALESEHVSEKEPEIATRLKAVESQALSMQKQARTIEALEGVTTSVGFTTVAQHASGGATTVNRGQSELNYRADVAVTLPTGDIGNAKGKLFGHVRIGQGRGLGKLRTSYSGSNASAFQLGGVTQPEDSAVMLAQAWYQADVPLPLGGFAPRSREHLEINFGKLDPFAFFDQNAAANDETRQFLASPFVHSALLDNPIAANVGANAYGFSPGVRLAYINEQSKPEGYDLSLGVFGAGGGANYDGSFGSPFVIAQWGNKLRFSGLEGNYRLYAWRNGRAPTYVSGETRAHRGFGASIDQRVGDATTLFARVGAASGEKLPFDRTLAFGAELGGSYWNRGADALGVGLAFNRTSADFRRDAATLDADADGNADYGWAADGYERSFEAYYRYRLAKQFEISPDMQLIAQSAGNRGVSMMKILGVRAQLSF